MDKIDYSIQYKKWHNDSIEHYENSSSYYERNFSHLLPKDKEANILDVGCGFGLAIYAMKKMGYVNVMGIDISPQQVDACHKKNLNVELVNDSVKWLEEHQNEFDTIISLDVLEHIPVEHHLRFLKAINKALKMDGKFVCTVPNANSTFASRWRYVDWTHFTSFCEHSLEFVILNSGFKSVVVSEIEFMKRPKFPFVLRKSIIHWILFKTMRYFRRLEAIAELGAEGKTIPLSLNILAVAQK